MLDKIADIISAHIVAIFSGTVALIFGAGVATGFFGTHETRIAALEQTIEVTVKQQLVPAVARTEQSVNDIKDALNIKHRDE